MAAFIATGFESSPGSIRHRREHDTEQETDDSIHSLDIGYEIRPPILAKLDNQRRVLCSVIQRLNMLRGNEHPIVAAQQITQSLSISGESINRLIVDGVILQGFKLTALVCLLLCGSAAVCALFMRTRLLEKGINRPVQKEEQSMTV